MTLAQSKLTAQGQISVPARVRHVLGVGPGSLIEWREQNGDVIVTRAARYTSEDVHRAVFARPPRPRTLATLEAGVRRHMRTRHAGR